MIDIWFRLLDRLPEWPLTTQRTSRARERNAFELGAHAAKACEGVKAWPTGYERAPRQRRAGR